MSISTTLMPSAQPPSFAKAPTKGTVTCERPAYPWPGGPPAFAKTTASTVSLYYLRKGRVNEPHVFSNALAVSMLSRNNASAEGFCFKPASLQSLCVHKVGMMMILAPLAISSRKASGKARSQHISRPTLPIGVSNTSCTSRPDAVMWSRSEPLCWRIVSVVLVNA